MYDAIDPRASEITLECGSTKLNEADTFTNALDPGTFRSAWANLPDSYIFQAAQA